MTEAEDVERAARQPHEREPRAAGSEGAATFGHYMVGVFDICGQSRKLRQEAGIPLSDDGVELQRIIANLKDTAGVVIGFRRLFRGFFGAASQPTGLADSLPEPQRAEMLAATTCNVLLWGVSDAFFVAVPLARTRHPAARVADVFRSLLAAGNMWLAGLNTNHPIRGGMEVGTGIDIEPGEIYGQALEAAYRLESKVADRPRIVVGPNCVEFLRAVQRTEDASDVASRLAANSAGRCLSILREDTDGHTIVDGLGQGMLEQCPSLQDLFPRAYDNVRANCRDFRDAGDTKLALRYEALRAYFEECAPRWHTKPRG